MIKRAKKLLAILLARDPLWLRALRYGVAAGIEHGPVLKEIDVRLVVDVGANRGQFALAVRRFGPTATVISFEPLPGPSLYFRRIFSEDTAVVLHNAAIGEKLGRQEMHISARDDSSSLLPIGSLQTAIFPGTAEASKSSVDVAPLGAFLTEDQIVGPALLKIDVQGYELEVLRGSGSLLQKFEWLYCECSFVEMYTGQALAYEIVEWLAGRKFHVQGIYNLSFNRKGQAVQADFLFHKGK